MKKTLTSSSRFWLLAIFLSLSLADLYLTWQLFENEGAAAREKNPLADWILTEFDWQGLACFKLVTAALVIVIAVAVSYVRPRTGTRLLTGSCAIVGSVVVYSLVLTFFPGAVSAESVALEQRIQEHAQTLDAALGKSKDRLTSKMRLMHEVLEERLSLADAVTQILAAEEEDSIRLEHIRLIHQGLPDHQCVALNLMEFIVIQRQSKSNDHAATKEVARKLARTYEATYGMPVPMSWWSVTDKAVLASNAQNTSPAGTYHYRYRRHGRGRHWGS